MEIEVLSPKRGGDMELYENYARSFPRANLYSSLLFGAFLNRLSDGFTPYYFMAKEGGKVVGILPSVLFKGKYGAVLNSMPWYGANPGVMADNTDIEWELLSSFIKTANWTGCISATLITRPFQTTDLYAEFFRGALTDTRTGLVTPIPSWDFEPGSFGRNIYGILHPKTRNQVVKSINMNTPFHAGKGADDAWEFLARVHRENMEKVGGPAKSKEFAVIRSMWREGVDYDLYFAQSNATKEPSAALLVGYYGETVEYLTPAIDVDYRPDNPLHCLIFHALRNASKKGHKYWNWGGTTLPAQESVYHFKKRWGAEECEYKYYTMILKDLPEGAGREEILKGYPYMYVLPFSHLTAGKNGGEGDADQEG